MSSDQQAFDPVSDYLREVSGPKVRGLPIALDTELYRDLGLYGDDLWELALWLNREFGVVGTFVTTRYGPSESPFARLRRRFFPAGARYESLSVRDLLSAIEAKQWP